MGISTHRRILLPFLVLVSLLFFPQSLQAKYVETPDMTSVRPLVDDLIRRYGSRDVVIVYDFDHTISRTATDFGGDAWFRWQISLLDAGLPHSALIENYTDVLLLQNFIMEKYPTKLMQPETPAFIRRYQSMRVPSLVITSRNPLFRDISLADLHRFGIDMSRTAPGPKKGFRQNYFPYFNGAFRDAGLEPDAISRYRLPEFPRVVRYDRGIFFTRGQNKGAMMKTLFAKAGFRPRAIVVIDDTKAHVDDTIAAYAGSKVEVLGVHYTRSPGLDADARNADKSEWIADFEAVKDELAVKMASKGCFDWLLEPLDQAQGEFAKPSTMGGVR